MERMLDSFGRIKAVIAVGYERFVAFMTSDAQADRAAEAHARLQLAADTEAQALEKINDQIPETDPNAWKMRHSASDTQPIPRVQLELDKRIS